MSNTIITITGPSCTGKTTLAQMLMDAGGFTEVVSTTTRSMRVGDVNGKSYHFVTKEQFDQIEMLETVEFNGNFYGGSVAEFEEKFESGLTPVIVVEPNGMGQINNNAAIKGWHVVNVFIGIPPELQARRFLTRMCEDYRSILVQGRPADYSDMIDEYSRRMATMQVVESKWYEMFVELRDEDNSLAFSQFDKSNEDSVLKAILFVAEGPKQLSRA